MLKRVIAIGLSLLIMFVGIPINGLEGVFTDISYVKANETSDEWAIYYDNGNIGIGAPSISLFVGESHVITTGNVGELTYISSDETVATVSADGVITASGIGECTVTVKSEIYGQRDCTVKVIENTGDFIDLSDKYAFKLTTEKTVKEYENYILKIDKGLYVSEGLTEMLDTIMATIEEVTGYSYYPQNTPYSKDKGKIVFEAINGGYVEPTGGYFGMTLDVTCVAAGELTQDVYALVHELIHVAQWRNTGNLGIPLGEGYAENFADDVMDILPYVRTEKEWDRFANYAIYADEDYNYMDVDVTYDNVEDIFIYARDSHPTSYYLVKYIRDKFGDDKLYEIIDNVYKKSNGTDISSEEIYALMKIALGTDFIYDFCDWFNATDRIGSVYDYTNYTSIDTQLVNYTFIDWCPLSVCYTNKIKIKDSIVINCEKSLAYAQTVLGQKTKGIYIDEISGHGILKFYDKNGNYINKALLSETTSLAVKGAVSMKIECDGEQEFYIRLSAKMFDVNAEYPCFHSYTNYIPNNDATCTVDGTKTAQCDNGCGMTDTKKDKGSKIAHTVVTDAAVPATCTEEGKTEGSHCSVCNVVLVAQEKVSTIAHTVVTDAAVPATCTEEGKTAGSHCSVCNEVLVAQEKVPTIAHTVVTDAAVPATCTEEGKTEGSHCSVCDEVLIAQEIVPTIAHTVVTDAAVPATCTEEGKTEGSHCSVCNAVLVAQEKVAATGHSYKKYVSNNDATCTEDGTKTAQCDNGCGMTDTKKDDGTAKGHGITETKNAYKATYKSSGYTGDIYCTVCNKKISSGNAISKLSAKKQTIMVKKKFTTYKAKKLKKKKATFRIGATAKEKVTYEVTKGSRKCISVNNKGIVTMKKGCKKGTYLITVRAAASSSGEYMAATKTIKIKIK